MPLTGLDRLTRNVSSGSLATESLRTSTLKVAEYIQAGMVTEPVLPVKSCPAVAVPLAVVNVTFVSSPLERLGDTVNVACEDLPVNSLTTMSPIEMVERHR